MKNRRVLFPALVFFFFFFIQSWLQLASAHTKCPDNGKYTLNSTYAVNLNDSLTILSRDVSDTGFFSTTAGDGGADRAYAVVLCGGDAQLEACRKCIRESPDQFLLWCPNRKQAIRWEDLCMVRYSDAPIYGVMATEPKVNWGKDSMTVSNATSPEQFGVVLRSLLDELHETSRSYLDWDRRYKIIGGIARGILYLHEDSRLKIIHRDLKPSNILLDGEMNPKIADFGMARLFGQDETQQNTSRVVGTYGYMPPEYMLHGQFSTKSDVFSFGVLVLEIICGRKNNNFRSRDNADDLLTFVWRNWREGTASIVVEPSLRHSTSEMVRCIHIGLLCVQENAAERPTMASVVTMLSSSSIGLPLPSAPAFYFPTTEISRLHDYNSGAANRIIRPSPTMRSQSPNSIHDDDF